MRRGIRGACFATCADNLLEVRGRVLRGFGYPHLFEKIAHARRLASPQKTYFLFDSQRRHSLRLCASRVGSRKRWSVMFISPLHYHFSSFPSVPLHESDALRRPNPDLTDESTLTPSASDYAAPSAGIRTSQVDSLQHFVSCISYAD